MRRCQEWGIGAVFAWLMSIMLSQAAVLNGYFCDPETVRSNAVAYYDKVLAPAIPMPPLRGLADNFFQPRKGVITGTLPSGPGSHEDFADYELVEVPLGARAEVGGLWWELMAQGIVRGDEVWLFSRGGRKLPLKEVVERDADATSLRRANEGFPVVSYHFQASPGCEYLIQGFQILDARNKWRLTNGYHWSDESTNTPSVTCALRRWQGGPVKLVVDVAFGPANAIQMEPRKGESILFDQWELRIVSIREQSGLATGGTPISVTEFALQRPVPSAFLPMAFQVFDLHGEVLRSSHRVPRSDVRVSSTFFQELPVLRVVSPLDEIGEIRASVYPNVRRLVFDMPDVYGLPEENRNLENLFEARIQESTAHSADEIRYLLESSLQLRFQQPRPEPHYPADYFPRVIENQSVGDLMSEYLSHSTNGLTEIKVDVPAGTIQAQKNAVRRLLDKARDLVK